MWVLYDSITPDTIPAHASAVAGYVGGWWPDYAEEVKRWPHAQHLSIAVNSGERARCLDVERGDSTPAEAPGWFQPAAGGQELPVFYGSIGQGLGQPGVITEIVRALSAAGIQRHRYFLWSADYTGIPHVNDGCDATQWTDAALGRNLDESLCHDWFFRAHAPPPPKPTLDVLLGPERRAVNSFDLYIKHPHLHVHGLRVVREELVRLRKEVWLAAHKDIEAGMEPGKAWAVLHRGERYRILKSRTAGLA
jgi:hypothetical protein